MTLTEEDEKTELVSFYGELIFGAMDDNITQVVSQLDSLDYQNYICFRGAIATILSFAEVIEKRKVKSNQWP